MVKAFGFVRGRPKAWQDKVESNEEWESEWEKRFQEKTTYPKYRKELINKHKYIVAGKHLVAKYLFFRYDKQNGKNK